MFIPPQFILENNIKKFAVIDIREYEFLLSLKDEEKIYFPEEVVDLVQNTGCSYIKAWRKFKNLTQKDVASALNITQSAYQQIEKSTSNKISALKKIATVFDVTWKHLTLED